MSDPTPASTPAKKAKASKPKKPKAPVVHPKYLEMSVSAINALKERNGSSRQAILKYIMSHFNVGKDPKVVNTHLKMALKRGVASGTLKHAKGQGASGSFRVSGDQKGPAKAGKVTKTKRAASAEPKAKKPKVKKPKAKVSKPASEKKAAKPKKVKKPKSPKKAGGDKKKAAKKPKTPKKASEKKRAAPKAKKAKSPKKAKK